MNGNGPPTKYTPQFWQGYLNNALAAIHANPHDMEAHQALALAEQNLRGTDSTGSTFTPGSVAKGLGLTGDAPSMGDVPMMPALGPLSPTARDFAPGGDVDQVATGVKNAVSGIPAGLAQLVHQLRHGDILGAGKGIAKGIGQTVTGGAAPIELALRELGGENVPDSTRSSLLQQGGQGLTGLATMEAGGKALSALRQGLSGGTPPSSPTAAPVTDPAPTTPPGFTPTSASGTPTPGSAGPIEPNPVALPMTVPPPAGFDPYASGGGASGLEANLSKLAQGLTPGKVPGLVGNEAGEASGASAQSGGAGASPFGGAATPVKLGGGQVSVEGPLPPESPYTPPGQTLSEMTGTANMRGTPVDVSKLYPSAATASDATRVAGQKGVTFGDQSSLQPDAQGAVKELLGQIARSRPGEAGFMLPRMLKIMVGLPIGAAILRSMKTTPEAIMNNPGLAQQFLNLAKSGLAGGTVMSPATDSLGIGNGNQ